MSSKRAKARPRRLHRYLRAWRQYRDLTQIDVGAALGVRHSTVGRWEIGTTPINILDMERLATLYGVEPAILLTDPLQASAPDEVDKAREILSKLDEADRADWLKSGERLARR